MTLKNRHIPLNGTPNLRDLGGYTNRHGKAVATGRMFRSGTLAYLDQQDWEKLGAMKLRVICDFRRDDEKKREPTIAPTDLDISIIELPVGVGSHTGFVTELLTQDKHSADSMADVMVGINRAFVLEHREPFQRVLEIALALQDDESMLFHCSAGKDRTGFAAAVLLSCLDVERDRVMEDYLLTREYYHPETELKRFQARMPDVDWASLYSERMLPMLDTRADYLGAAFDAIDAHFGSTDAFLADALGVDADMREELQSKFLS
ncbi:MAG: tyrosine-protein phosphatase [Gammaproteobacteria bacterium]|nr:tyrosine-protein phosphatase [Gammaproteobacteria bacterium]NND39829.1 tyrosine-protein phosphatase [Pseudomonadales bacterium]MBT8150981.1 tyrosine-protein phosphatase [Gammaproteobacteria bacterium]NNL11332.1 tyrosine-protein phosphatase [Pseudomonadales bacterium]NNM11165.1 tyrosine-protein phosphatase [Pseudomonadales bacterium]